MIIIVVYNIVVIVIVNDIGIDIAGVVIICMIGNTQTTPSVIL